jgi:hypothetical protein
VDGASGAGIKRGRGCGCELSGPLTPTLSRQREREISELAVRPGPDPFPPRERGFFPWPMPRDLRLMPAHRLAPERTYPDTPKPPLGVAAYR